MDLQSYIQLKQMAAQAMTPQQINEEVEAVEEEILNEFDSSEGKNIPNRAGTGHKNTDTKKDWANDPRWGVVGQLERARRKTFGTDREKRQANSYETSVNNIAKRQKTTPGQAKITANDVAAETKGRRKADPNYVPGKNQASNKIGSKSAEKKPEKPTQEPATQEPATTKKISQPAKPAAPARDRMADKPKAERMAAWAKANPTLAKKNPPAAAKPNALQSGGAAAMKAARSGKVMGSKHSTPKPPEIKSPSLRKALAGVKPVNSSKPAAAKTTPAPKS